MNATMLPEKVKHLPVMLDQILSIITPQHGGTFIDCTFGGGGYSKEILKFPNTTVIAIDRDKKVQKYATELSKLYPSRFKFINDKFSNLSKIIDPKVRPCAIIFDLGFSSLQIFDEERGFSFNSKGSLSMEMGINDITTKYVLNNFSPKSLINLLKMFGEEKDAKKIVKEIIKFRKDKNIEKSTELSNIVKKAKKKFYKTNPSTKTFQALRIFVNKEISELLCGLISATKILQENGQLVLVSFHSIEEKIINYFLNYYSKKKAISRYVPEKTDEKDYSLFLQKKNKVIKPSKNELSKNLSSRSAKLRYGIRNKNKHYNFQDIFEKFNQYIDIEHLNS